MDTNSPSNPQPPPPNNTEYAQHAQHVQHFLNLTLEQALAQDDALERAVHSLSQLVAAKAQLTITPHGDFACAFCAQHMRDASQVVHNTATPRCHHAYHKQCVRDAARKADPYLSTIGDNSVRCPKCTNEYITRKCVVDAYGGIDEFRRVEEQLGTEYANEIQREWDRREREENDRRAREREFDCQICYTTQRVADSAITLNCDHVFCNECLVGYVNDKRGDPAIYCPTCLETRKDPAGGLPEMCEIDHNILRGILNAEQFEALADLRLKLYKPRDPNYIFVMCPCYVRRDNEQPLSEGDRALFMTGQAQALGYEVKDCNYPIEWDRRRNDPFIKCGKCEYKFCLLCKDSEHPGMTCQQRQEQRQRNQTDNQYNERLLRKRPYLVKRCPNEQCKAIIVKNGGCNHMTCRGPNGMGGCGMHFCWICSALYQTGNEVYAHINQQHPGQLFWVDPRANQPDAWNVPENEPD